MGLKPRIELLQTYFIYAQAGFIVFAGFTIYQNRLHRRTVDERNARDEIPRRDIFGELINYAASGYGVIIKKLIGE